MGMTLPGTGSLIIGIARKIVPQNLAFPILSGPLAGRRWVFCSGNIEHVLGTYESAKAWRIAEAVRAGFTFYDIGAHVGYYTILASRFVGTEGRVLSFEPLPRNIKFLREHIERNKCRNVTVIESAVAEKSGESMFFESSDSYTGRLRGNGSLRVEVVCLDDLFDHGIIPAPDCLKIDVEGAELDVLRGSKRLLTRCSPTLFLATHDELLKHSDMRIQQECRELLASLGYTIAPLMGDNLDCATDLIGSKQAGSLSSTSIDSWHAQE